VRVQDELDVLMEDQCLQWLKQPKNQTTAQYTDKHQIFFINEPI
jgi:hypothetical protein